jgi:hypothetical protein
MTAVAQEGKEQHREARQITLLTRVAFQSNLPVSLGDSGFTQVCIALTQDGQFSLVRRRTTGIRESLTGSLKPDEQKVFYELLAKARQEDSTGGFLLRHDAQLVRLEVAASASTTRRSWVSASDEGIDFPSSVQNVVNWLQRFEAADAKPVDLVPDQVCPGGELKPLQPSRASR